MGKERKHRRQCKCSPRRTVLELASGLLRQEIESAQKMRSGGRWVPQFAVARMGRNRKNSTLATGGVMRIQILRK